MSLLFVHRCIKSLYLVLYFFYLGLLTVYLLILLIYFSFIFFLELLYQIQALMSLSFLTIERLFHNLHLFFKYTNLCLTFLKLSAYFLDEFICSRKFHRVFFYRILQLFLSFILILLELSLKLFIGTTMVIKIDLGSSQLLSQLSVRVFQLIELEMRLFCELCIYFKFLLQLGYFVLFF